jgi:hypothetical protein
MRGVLRTVPTQVLESVVLARQLAEVEYMRVSNNKSFDKAHRMLKYMVLLVSPYIRQQLQISAKIQVVEYSLPEGSTIYHTARRVYRRPRNRGA